MAKHVFLALVNAAHPDRTAEFEAFYDDHMKELLETPGFVGAQFYKLNAVQRSPNLPYQYLALYEIESDDVAVTMDELGKRAGTIIGSDLLDRNFLGNLFTPVGPRKLAA